MQIHLRNLAESMPDEVASLVQRAYGQTPVQFVETAAEVAEDTGAHILDVIDEALFVAAFVDSLGGVEDDEDQEEEQK